VSQVETSQEEKINQEQAETSVEEEEESSNASANQAFSFVIFAIFVMLPIIYSLILR